MAASPLRQRAVRLFGNKEVLELSCVHCTSVLCHRAMQAVLLADSKTELFSTDATPSNTVSLIGNEYRTSCCDCRISDFACLECGNPCGYHVTHPCSTCLKACNNGHLWMFHGQSVRSTPRVDGSYDAGLRILRWIEIPSPSKEFISAKQRAHPFVRPEEDCVR